MALTTYKTGLRTPSPFTARFAADRLTALARAQGLMDRPMPEVLFVCDRNPGVRDLPEIRRIRV